MKNEQVVQLPLNRLTQFPEHPFKVRERNCCMEEDNRSNLRKQTEEVQCNACEEGCRNKDSSG